MTTTVSLKGRTRAKHYICGWCATAARSTETTRAHRRCYGPCACGTLQHRFTPDLAAVMADTCKVPIDTIYQAHGRKRRVLTDDQKAAAAARLAAYRERVAS